MMKEDSDALRVMAERCARAWYDAQDAAPPQWSLMNLGSQLAWLEVARRAMSVLEQPSEAARIAQRRHETMDRCMKARGIGGMLPWEELSADGRGARIAAVQVELDEEALGDHRTGFEDGDPGVAEEQRGPGAELYELWCAHAEREAPRGWEFRCWAGLDSWERLAWRELAVTVIA
jgi:hypothetical protein